MKFLITVLLLLSSAAFASVDTEIESPYQIGATEVISTFKVGKETCRLQERYIGANYSYCPTGSKIREVRLISPRTVVVYCFAQEIVCE